MGCNIRVAPVETMCTSSLQNQQPLQQNGIDFAWQSRFHYHIVRNTDKLNRNAEYIKNNAANWQTDELNNKR